MLHQIATVFGIGHLRPAPGTWGSLAALPVAWALHQLGGFPLLAAATVLVTVSVLLLITLEVLRRRSERLRGLSPN